MKILYSFQNTGNGHLSRAEVFVPLFKKYADVDVMCSGFNSSLKASFDIDFNYKGFSFLYNNSGNIDYIKTIQKNDYLQFAKDIFQTNFEYDLVINDFEPLSIKIAEKNNIKTVGLSHQSSFLSKKCPVPKRKNVLGEFILKNFAPSKINYGFHFENYDENIYTPIIRDEIRNAQPIEQEFYLVYLPSFSEQFLLEHLSKIDKAFYVFSKTTKDDKQIKNITFKPISHSEFVESLILCEGVLCNSGFELPSEALYLGKKLYTIPIGGQYEQMLNFLSLKKIGVDGDTIFSKEDIEIWIKNNNKIKITFPDIAESIVEKIISTNLK